MTAAPAKQQRIGGARAYPAVCCHLKLLTNPTSSSPVTVPSMQSVVPVIPQEQNLELIAIPLDEIIVLPERQRKALGDDKKKAKVAFEDLKTSMRTVGQLQPVRIDHNQQLVAGFRRLSAAREIGWTHIWAIFDDVEMDELTREIMELDENIQRLDLSWDERTAAIARINEIRTKMDPTWTQRKTAEVAGTVQSKVSEAVKVTKMLEMFPELKKAKSAQQALSWAKKLAKQVIRTQEVADNPVDFAEIESRVLIGDSVDLIKTFEDGSFHAIITDPPFGIGYDERKAGTENSIDAYEDSPEAYKHLVTMADDMYRVLKPDGWLVWFLGPTWYEYTKLAFRAAGFTVDEIPLIWDRSKGRNYTARPDRYFGRAYDMALHCIKGNPEMVKRGRSQGNIFSFEPVAQADKEFIVERPIELYQELLDHLTIPGERVLDLFAGSGKVAAACASRRRDYITCELHPERKPMILNTIRNHTPK